MLGLHVTLVTWHLLGFQRVSKTSVLWQKGSSCSRCEVFFEAWGH